jgi:DNA adenine methylase
MKPTRPLVRYHGAKWILAPWIIAHFPAHRIYTETFGGGASVLLRKPRSYAEVYNDLDGEMVNLFRVVREHPRTLRRLLKWTSFSRVEYRHAFELTDDPIEMARRTIIRSRMGFGSNSINRKVKSGFRANSNRSGTTPARDWTSVPVNIHRVARRFFGVVLENKPAVEIIEQHDTPETLHYLDPPYVWDTRSASINGHGYAHEMSDAQHEELASIVKSVKGMVVLSGYPSRLYDRLYAGWNQVEREALADGAGKRTEVLWFNAAAWDRLHAGKRQGALFSPSAA